MAHKGVREFTSEELSGIALGQCGFKVLTNATYECGVETGGGITGLPNIQYFVALKVIETDADVEARSVTAGDDLTLASGGTADFSSPVALVNGDIIYGAFDKVEVASGDYVIAYVGK